MSTAPKRALIVIDVQNEYITGKLPIAYPPVRNSLENIGRAIDTANACSIPVVIVQQTSPKGSPIFARETSGWQLHDVVKQRPYGHYVEKSLPSAFAGTDLSEWLGAQGIDTVTIAGYMTHNCDDATVKDAMHAGLQVEFIADAAGSLPYGNDAGSASAEEIHRVIAVVMHSRFAAVTDTATWIGAAKNATPLKGSNILASHECAVAHLTKMPTDIELRPAQAGDIETIACWPKYPEEFADLDYALRQSGWLQEFMKNPAARCFVATENDAPIAFTTLAKTAEDEAEFRIALRADRLGQGLGRSITQATLAKGFEKMRLTRIHLIVRKNNQRARSLYRKIGFVPFGERIKTVNEKAVEFVEMEILRTHDA